MITYTNFMTDPDDPAVAIVYEAYVCDWCHQPHRRMGVPMSRSPWGRAVCNGLIQTLGIPKEGCPKNK